MEQLFKVLTSDITIPRIQKDLVDFLDANNFADLNHISLTGLGGEDDWDIGGDSDMLEKYRAHHDDKVLEPRNVETHFSQLNKGLEGTYMGDLIQRFDQYYRWRLLKINPGTTYPIHTDAPHKDLNFPYVNKRIHIPIQTNPWAFFCYLKDRPSDGLETTIKYHHMPVGHAYEVNTSLFHTAVNYGETPRYHMVGIRYEKETVI